MWFEPTSVTKSIRILPAIRSIFSSSSSLTPPPPPISYISPNVLELRHLFESIREGSISPEGREVPALTSLDGWFGSIDRLGLRTGISSDMFRRLGGKGGEWLNKEGVVQMCVQMMPFFKCLVVKCGERGDYYITVHAISISTEVFVQPRCLHRPANHPINILTSGMAHSPTF